MTLRTLTMPRLGETMEEGTISAWLVAPGSAFRRGDALLEVETDKTVVEFPALSDGVLEEVLAKPGKVVAVGAPIARITAQTWGDDDPEGAPPPDVGTHEAASPDPVVRYSSEVSSPPPHKDDSQIRATPLARSLARKAGIALGSVTGTGRRGRVEARDISMVEDAASVVLVHGFAGDGQAWASLAAALSRAGCRVIAPDLPGHGGDARRPDSLNDLSDALADMVRNLRHPFHLVGHSMGACLAAGLAAKNPARISSLTLIAPAGLGREIDTDFVYGMADATTPAEVAHLLRRLGPAALGLSVAGVAALATRLSDGRLANLARAVCGPSGQKIDILSHLARLPQTLRVRAIIGTQDRIIPPRHAFYLPARVAVHFVQTGHMPQWDAPAEVAGIIATALAGVAGD